MIYLVKYYKEGKKIDALDELSNVQTSFLKKTVDKFIGECLRIEVMFNDLLLYSIEGSVA